MSFIKDRFIAASYVLKEEGPLRLKLHDAFVYHIMHINRSEVPEGCLDDFDYIHTMMTSASNNEGNIVSESLMQMSDEETETIAARIMFVCAALLAL